jgi:hypothetical protein
MIEAIFGLYKAENIFCLAVPRSGTDQGNWDSLQKHTKAYLCLYIKPDMYSLITPDTDYPTFKDKWDKLRDTYSMVVLWAAPLYSICGSNLLKPN